MEQESKSRNRKILKGEGKNIEKFSELNYEKIKNIFLLKLENQSITKKSINVNKKINKSQHIDD